MSDDIYSYILENFGIEITDYQFKRDYIKNPLKKGSGGFSKGEKPYKEDLEYLYINKNFRIIDLIKLFCRSKRTIDTWVKKISLSKNKNMILNNIKETCMKKYGFDFSIRNKNIRNKSLKTLKEKYNVNNPSQISFVKEKVKETCMKKYGVNYYVMTDEFIKNNLEHSKEMVLKRQETMRKNNTYGKSKDEDKIFNLLIQKYQNVKRQYKSNLYPFLCDFYIPEIDLYIEYNGYWTHGKIPYIGSDEQNKIIELWESKNTSQYNKAIVDWTIRDPLKRKTAKENGLNWIEFFTMDEFINWYNQN